MNWSTQVRHVMSRELITIDIAAPPSTIRKLLDDVSFHHLPVVREGVLVGIVSTHDIARHSLGVWVNDQETLDAHLDEAFTIEDIMTWEPVAVLETDTVRAAANKLADGQFHALPVLDDEGHLSGILTSTDLLRWMIAQ